MMPVTTAERGRYIHEAIEERARRLYIRTGARWFFCNITPRQFEELTTFHMGRPSDHRTKLCELGIASGRVLIRGDRETETDGIELKETTQWTA